MKKETKEIAGYIQVYTIWVNGRAIFDLDHHFPITATTDNRAWVTDFDSIVKDYQNVKILPDKDYPNYTEVFQDAIVILFSISIDIAKFEVDYETKFDINSPETQECIPYYCNYDFNVVAEKILQFTR